MKARPDVVALITGVVLTSLAVVVLGTTVFGPPSWSLVKIVAPLLLVAVGVVGLALSRNRG